MTDGSLAQECAAVIHDQFVGFQNRFVQITQQASDRFVRRQWAQLHADTKERLQLYAAGVKRALAEIAHLSDSHAEKLKLWCAAKTAYARLIAGNHDRELAETFFNSVSRRVFNTVGVNPQIEFGHNDASPLVPSHREPVYKTYPLADSVARVVGQIISDHDHVGFEPKTLPAAIEQISDRIERRLKHHKRRRTSFRIEMVRSVFYRGQGAYLIGRIVIDGQMVPLVIALVHPPEGVRVDALLLDADDVSILFSYTRSAFYVSTGNLRDLVSFLGTIMPAKPEAELYFSLGYFKHGKTVLYRDLCRHTDECTDEQFFIAPGKKGMVMVVFEIPGNDMVVKLIRDHFDDPKNTTRKKVMEQYDFVFSHYRVGRLIEAHAFEHLSFDRCWFGDALVAHLTTEAGQTVRIEGDRVIIDHAYLERRVIPLDIYLQEAPRKRADAVVLDFGNAIKDLAYANIFPGDMLLKNFGVTRHHRVVFYDYDEIVPLTDCRFRKIPSARSYMEEMAAEPWYTIAENDVFPEEFSRFLGLSADHRKLFLSRHADLLTPDFWVAAQKEIRSGRLRHIHPYHPRNRLILA